MRLFRDIMRVFKVRCEGYWNKGRMQNRGFQLPQHREKGEATRVMWSGNAANSDIGTSKA